ncbi:MAG: hypothetical protein SCK29_05215 [Bacillota bacterium]|nr:hypothetical protein [Bacillota bacterium]MDW7683502.1 hypothetical protein [Bacillota bacterium]
MDHTHYHGMPGGYNAPYHDDDDYHHPYYYNHGYPYYGGVNSSMNQLGTGGTAYYQPYPYGAGNYGMNQPGYGSGNYKMYAYGGGYSQNQPYPYGGGGYSMNQPGFGGYNYHQPNPYGGGGYNMNQPAFGGYNYNQPYPYGSPNYNMYPGNPYGNPMGNWSNIFNPGYLSYLLRGPKVNNFFRSVGMVTVGLLLVPSVARAFRPLVVSAVEGAFSVSEEVKNIFADAKEDMDDIFAEAKWEDVKDEGTKDGRKS